MRKILTVTFAVLLVLAWVVTMGSNRSKAADIQKSLENAAILDKKGIYIDAIEEYNKVLEETPDDMNTLLKLAADYKAVNEMTDYINTMRRAVETFDPGYERALDEMLLYYHEDGKTEEEVRLIAELKAEYPEQGYVNKKYQELRGSYKQLYFNYEDVGGVCSDTISAADADGLCIVDAEGTEITRKNCRSLTPFSGDGYAGMEDKKGDIKYIDRNGYTRIAPDETYSDLGMVSRGMIAACEKGKYGFLNVSGEKATEFKWDGVTNINNCGFARMGSQWAVIDSRGKEKTDYVYEDVAADEYGNSFSQERAFVKSGGKWQMINTKGESIGTEAFEDVKPFNNTGYAAVCIKGKWGFVNDNGEIVIDCIYDNADSFSNGYAAVEREHRWGYIDHEGSLLIDFIFEKAYGFTSAGTAAVLVTSEENMSQWQLIQLIIETL